VLVCTSQITWHQNPENHYHNQTSPNAAVKERQKIKQEIKESSSKFMGVVSGTMAHF